MSADDNHNSDNSDVKKTITISGIHNRYQVKKLIGRPVEKVRRVTAERWGIPTEYFSLDRQPEILDCLYNNKDCKRDALDYVNDYAQYYSIIHSQIINKIGGYRQQDRLKKLLDESQFITYDYVVEKIKESELKCHYCQKEMYILYEISRDFKQWTIDRIDNTKGHNQGNIVISCLDCNLKRGRINKDAFKFTKNLKIKKQE